MHPEVRAKQMQTHLERYGSHWFASEQGKQTVREAMREKYGVDHIMQVPGAWDRLVETFLERYGVEHPLHLEEFQTKQRATNIERHGTPFPGLMRKGPNGLEQKVWDLASEARAVQEPRLGTGEASQQYRLSHRRTAGRDAMRFKHYIAKWGFFSPPSARATEVVDDYVRDTGSLIPPVPVESIAEWLGAELRPFDHDQPGAPDWDGALDWRDTSAPPVVWYRRQNRNRERLTIAHELGHLCLHVAESQRQGLTVFYRDETLGSHRGRAERQANDFAAAMLMPKSLIDEHVLRFGADERLLAQKFQVSRDAMHWRLLNLRHLG